MVDKTKDENSASNQNEGDSDAPKYVTIEQLNQAITARFRSFETKQTDSFTRLETLFAQGREPAAPEEPAKPSKKIQDDPLVQALTNQVKLLETERTRNRALNLRAKVQEELLAGKVNPQLVKPLLAQFEVDKTFSYASDTSDEIVGKFGESIFTLKDGVSTYLSSEDAKPFLSPKGAAGSGDKPYTSNTSKSPQPGARLSAEAAGDAIRAFLTGSGE